VQGLEQDNTASFHYIHGTYPQPPANGFEEFFGSPPHLRFFESYCGGETNNEFLQMLITMPPSLTPEQKFRYLLQRRQLGDTPSTQNVLDRLYQIIDEEGPFEGIMGLSEGGAMAATFLVDYFRRELHRSSPLPLKCAVFLSGQAPCTTDGKTLVLADEFGQIIPIPTCHIIGYNDPLIDSSVALYHLCDEKSASIVDHGKGHMPPRDPESCELMAKGIRDVITRAETSLISPA
jgi:Serine hydrolase (FSH1)